MNVGLLKTNFNFMAPFYGRGYRDTISRQFTF